VRIFLVAAWAIACFAASSDDTQFNGRWDINANGGPPWRGWWLEVSGAGTNNVRGKFVGGPIVLVDEIPRLSISDGELRFALQARFRRDRNVETGLYWARLEDGRLKGTFEIEGDPSSYLEWIGMRAPVLPDKDDGSWKRGDAVPLFDGHTLAGWQMLGGARPSGGWTVKDGLLTGSSGAPDLVSDRKFWNFAVEVEYRLAPRANGGVSLRGRYQVPIVDDADKPPSNRGTGAILGRLAPMVNEAAPPGEWQTLVVRLVGRQVTVLLNGVRVIERQAIDGPTAMALDANEADPGPLVLRSEHGPLEFRKVVVYPLIKRP